MNSQYWLISGRFRPHSWCSSATARGVAWIPRMVCAGSPGIRWIMKKTMIVTPMATGTSCSRRRSTNVIRPMGAAHLPRSPGRLARRWLAVLAPGPGGDRPGPASRLLAEPDVLEVVVAERGDEETVDVGGGGVGVGRVVEERHERVGGRVGLDGVVQRLPGCGGQGLLGRVRGLDHRRVVVGGEEGPGARVRV